MPRPVKAAAAAATLVAVLWVTSCRCVGPASPGVSCDNGKLHLDRDLSADAVYWECRVPAWPESTQGPPSSHTVHHPKPPMKICMNKPISYNHAIPNSGAFRPVGAESGEYLYCPPQRWLNNLHYGATVLLHHPCAPLRERHLLSALAHACLSNYVITPHPHLHTQLPVAVVSWGRTLELATAASAELCHWLQSTQTRTDPSEGATQTRKYNLLLIRAAPLHRPEPSKDSVGRCCRDTVSSLLRGAREAEPAAKEKRWREEERKSRAIRAAVRKTQDSGTRDAETATARRTADVQTQTDQVASNVSETGTGSSEPEEIREARPTHPDADGEQNSTARPGGQHKDVDPKMNRAEGKMKDEEGVDLKERELELHRKLGDHRSSDNRGSDPTSEAQTAAKLRSRTSSSDCGSCDAGRRCDCTTAPGAETRAAAATAAAVNQGFPRTPRTDEAVWAAAALGFLLVLLTLSVLHTRLYRSWRTAPSLYWHDPRRDYDSVADVIRRRLRIANRRRKRGRRRECVLLPSSSSSGDDE